MEDRQLHPDRFEEPKPAALTRENAAAIAERWFNEHFHGAHHVRALADPYGYISGAVTELKRRLTEET